MNEIQIKVIKAESLHRPVESSQCGLVAVFRISQLAGDKNRFSVLFTFTESSADTFLIAVQGGRVDVTVPGR
jgi:hypothetical protein